MNEPVTVSGPPEPVLIDGKPHVYVPNDDGTNVRKISIGEWECQRCMAVHEIPPVDGELPEPYECPGCERQGPFQHVGLSETEVEIAIRAPGFWKPPTGISDSGSFKDLWADVRDFIRDYWDAGRGENAEAVYGGLTAFALSTWIRPELQFVPHLMLMGKTTGGKTRLLNTLARVSYRGVVSASATPASMFRLIDGYDVSYYISEYHGIHYETRQQIDAVVRSGQKRGEVVTRADPTTSGYEPKVYDPFTHIAIATQYEPADDIINRCIQVRSSSADRDMPATFDETRANEIRNRLLYFRFALLDSETYASAETAAYATLARREINGRTREKLVSLLALAHVCDRADRLDGFIERVQRQDKEAAADSEDAIVVEAVRDLAFQQLRETTTIGDNPFSAVKIPYSDVCERYGEVTGEEDKTPQWFGHVRKRLGFGKTRDSSGTIIHDPKLGEKLRKLCDDLNLEWNPPEEVAGFAASLESKKPVVVDTVRMLGEPTREEVIDAIPDDIDNPDELIDSLVSRGRLTQRGDTIATE